MDSALNPPDDDLLNENEGNDRFYVLLKVIGRIELYAFAIGVLFYFISASVSWRFDAQTARKYAATVKSVLHAYPASIASEQQKQLQSQMDRTLDSLKLPRAYCSNFLAAPTGGSFNWTVVPPTVADDQISPLEGVSSWKRSDVDAEVKKQLGTSTKGLDIYQFVIRGAFASSSQLILIIALLVLLSLIFITQGAYYYHTVIRQKIIQKQQDSLRAKVQDGKEASPVWELAQLTLNKYYSRNLSQNNWIFYVSVAVMSAGFGLVLYGIALAYGDPNNHLATIVSAGSGVIVQFIGATFLVIYNSTITQAIQYTSSLQKVSTVGTSIKILDSIKEDETDEMKGDKEYVRLMIDAKIAIAKLLIEQSKRK